MVFMKKMGSPRAEKVDSIDLSPLFVKYLDQWVALTEYTPDYEVICNGRTAQSVYKKAIDGGHQNPVIFRVSKALSHAIL